MSRASPGAGHCRLKLEHSSGLHLIGQLRALDPHILIVMLTGYSSISTTVDAIKLGATNYLCKPPVSMRLLPPLPPRRTARHWISRRRRCRLSRLEWEHIQRGAKENDGNISATARALGMHRRTLQRKLGKRPVKS